MSKALQQLRAFIAQNRASGHKVNQIETSQAVVDEVGASVDGVPLVVISARRAMLAKGILYAQLRWSMDLDEEDLAPLFKAVDDGELWSLLPLVIDQEMDARDVEDPWVAMELDEALDRSESLKELGFEDPGV